MPHDLTNDLFDGSFAPEPDPRYCRICQRPASADGLCWLHAQDALGTSRPALPEARGRSRKDDPETAKGAGYTAPVNALEQATIDTLAHAWPGGLTTFEIAVKSGHDRDSISPRMPRLVKFGMVEDSGEKRVPEGKRRPAIVWKLTVDAYAVTARKVGA